MGFVENMEPIIVTKSPDSISGALPLVGSYPSHTPVMMGACSPNPNNTEYIVDLTKRLLDITSSLLNLYTEYEQLMKYSASDTMFKDQLSAIILKTLNVFGSYLKVDENNEEMKSKNYHAIASYHLILDALGGSDKNSVLAYNDTPSFMPREKHPKIEKLEIDEKFVSNLCTKLRNS